ncbi:MAG TPA: methyltransferase domain-containing protein [Solirubrobacteraceae bacterium]|jgi:SAM-dependent methyltransferase|nr:methyltransferase domain-containing protein [Solirubrobacteraceae bacterium]
MVVSPSDAVIWHDLECGSYTADLALWHELAVDARARVAPTPGSRPGRVLDIGAGTGRVALALARAGHPVTAVDLDAELLDALSARTAGLDLETVRADARLFELDRRDFALCLAPMQTLQLLGGTTGRLEFMARARAHLAPGGLLACAIVTEIDPFDCDAGDLGPSEEVARIAGAAYISRATRVLLDSRVVRIERERGIVPRGRAEREPTWEHDVIELDRVSVAQLEREGHEAKLTAAGTRVIPATEEHTASMVVMFRA